MNGCYLSLFPQSSKARRYQPTPRSPSWWKRRQTRARHLARLDRIHPRQQRNCRLQQNLVRWTLDPTRTRRQFPLPDSARLRRPQKQTDGFTIGQPKPSRIAESATERALRPNAQLLLALSAFALCIFTSFISFTPLPAASRYSTVGFRLFCLQEMSTAIKCDFNILRQGYQFLLSKQSDFII